MLPNPFIRSFVLSAIAGLALLPAGAAAQGLGSITGTIRAPGRDSARLEGARVVLLGTAMVANSNRHGEFTFHGLQPGSYTVQASAIGFRTSALAVQVRPLETSQVTFIPEPEVVVLPEVEATAPVRGTADFLRRRASGRGRYFTREEIERRDPKTLGDLLRMVPGLRLECRGMVCRVHSARGGRSCVPGYFMDGLPVDGNAIWLTPPQDLQAMEVYAGPSETPPELEHRASCGAIVLWTRMPPERQPKEKPAQKP